jgi:hypothetical protein
MKEKLKKIAEALAKDAGVEMARGYIVKRVQSISPEQLKQAIQNMDTDLVSKLSDKDLKIASALAEKYSQYLNLINVENVFKWLIADLPFYAGVIYGHPQGIQWLTKTLEDTKKKLTREERVELIPVEAGEGG